MGTDQEKAQGIIGTFLARANRGDVEVVPALHLYGDGLGLDSLEAAELSAMLEDEFGSDPFSSGDELPETIADILAFYEVSATA